MRQWASGRDLRGAGDRAVRWRYPLLAVGLVIGIVLKYTPQTLYGDWWIFRFGAQALSGTLPARQQVFVSSPLHLYVDMPRLQAGPPSLVASVPFGLLPNPAGRLLVACVMALALLPILLLLERTAGLLGVPAARVRRTTLLGGLLVAPLWISLSVVFLHPDDVLALALVVVAVHELVRGHGLIAALALGTSAAAKPWAVAFIVLVLVLPRERRAPAGLLAIATAGAWWLPFLLAAPGTTGALGSLTAPVAPDTVLALFTHGLPPWLRTVQLVAMVVAALLCARSRAWLLTPLVAVAVRIALDWQTWTYYGAGLLLAALLWDVLSGRRWPRLTVLATAPVVLPAVLAPVNQSAAAVLRVLLLAALVAAGLVWDRRRPDLSTAVEPDRAAGSPEPRTTSLAVTG